MGAILTFDQLKKAAACSACLTKFQTAFGTAVEITEALAVEQAANWDWYWAAQKLLTPENNSEYERRTAQALAEYQRLKAQTWAKLYIAQVGDNSKEGWPV